MNEQVAAEEAHVFLRSHSKGELRFDEHCRPLKYVIAPDGRLVAPVMYAMLQCVDSVLFIPELVEDAMEVQVTPSPLDAAGPDAGLTDRWRIYHGDPQDTHWARFEIDAARFNKWVIDGTALVRVNPLSAEEPRLCREINRDHADTLRRFCTQTAGLDVEAPTLVGVDPLGFDVRRRFDVVRAAAPGPMTTPDEVLSTLLRTA
jgi:hypothetical protein